MEGNGVDIPTNRTNNGNLPSQPSAPTTSAHSAGTSAPATPAPQPVAESIQLNPPVAAPTPAPVATSPTTNSETANQPQEGKHYLAVFFLSFMWGLFGVDRMYLGYWASGIVKLITFGGFGIWYMTDLAVIMSGGMKDSKGRPMLEYERYKKFANRTVMIFTIATALFILATGIELILALQQVMNGLLGGGGGGSDQINQLLQGNSSSLGL